MMISMVSIILGFMLMIGQNPGYINRPSVVPDPITANPTDFERERNIFLDHVDNITRIDETKNGETSQITTEIPLDTDYSKLNQYSRFDNWGLDYDKNGNLTQKSTQKMYFDYKNRMVRVTEGTAATESKYDALGRRLQKIFTAGSQSKTENYYYSGHQIVEVRDGSDQVKRQFIYGNGIDEVIRMDVYSGSIATPYYLHINEIGSTTAVTDADGNVVERYKYGLYGMPAFMDAAGNVIPKSAIGNNILFQGREYEPETNFYYFRARHLDPIMGRFLQTDPTGYEDSLNLYQALNMNPVNFFDPFGEESYLDFLDRKIADMMSRGYSESFINQMISGGTFKRGYLAQVQYRNAYVDEMPGIEDSFWDGVDTTRQSYRESFAKFMDNITDPDTIANTIENLPEIIKNKAESFSTRLRNTFNEGGVKSIFAVQIALGKEAYEASPIPEFTVAANPSYTIEERADAFIGFLFKMGTYILAAKNYQPGATKGGSVQKGITDTGNIKPYNQLQKELKDAGFSKKWEAHKLVEKRHQIGEWRESPAVPLKKGRGGHQDITNMLRNQLPYGQRYPIDQIIQSIKQTYNQFLDWIKESLKWISEN